MKYYLIIPVLICCMFSSCDLTSTSNNTPQILFAKLPQLNGVDTLYIKYTDEAGVYLLDTISVGDTVTFRFLLNGFSNSLTSYNIVRSDTVSSKLLLPGKNSLDSVFNSVTSNYSIGKFVFKTGILNLYFPFKYVATKETVDARISFSLVSDAKFEGGSLVGSSYYNFVLKTPVRKKKM